MNLRRLYNYVLFRDTTMKGEFRIMQKLLGADCPKVVVDVGANDGFYGSNSFPFVARKWRAVLIEPHPEAYSKLKSLHHNRPHVTCLNLACGETPGELPLWFSKNDPGGTCATLCDDEKMRKRRLPDNSHMLVRVARLDAILTEQGIPFEIGVLSIDAEGMDYEVLLGMDLNTWRPRLIVTEDYPSKNQRKASYLTSHGYRHAAQCGDNAMWTR